MKIDGVKIPKSSFLSVEKDMGIIMQHLLKCKRLGRLLYYTTNDAVNRKDLNDKETMALVNRNIRMVPKLLVEEDILNYVIINFDNFVPSSNPEFRDNIIEFDIICHYDQWLLDDFQLRPYRIAAEVDALFDKQHLTGIGKLEFIGATQLILTDEFAGLCLMYRAVHGGEDKFNMPNPKDQERFEQDFEALWKEEPL